MTRGCWLWFVTVSTVACTVPAPATDDSGVDGSAGKAQQASGNGGAAGSAGASGAGKAGAGGPSSGGAGAAQAGAAGDPFGGGGSAGAAQAGATQAGQGGAPPVCTPGQQIACACPGGVQGAQACNTTGTGYEPCDCPGGGGGSGATAGSAGTTSSGGATSAGSGGNATVDPVGDSEKCPGAELAFTGSSITVSGTTKPATSDYAPAKCTSAASGDVVYRFVAPKSGVVTATVDPTGFDAVVYWSEATCSGDSPKACSASKGGFGDPESIDMTVVAGKTYWVFVDGWTFGFAGAFELSLSY